ATGGRQARNSRTPAQFPADCVDVRAVTAFVDVSPALPRAVERGCERGQHQTECAVDLHDCNVICARRSAVDYRDGQPVACCAVDEASAGVDGQGRAGDQEHVAFLEHLPGLGEDALRDVLAEEHDV